MVIAISSSMFALWLVSGEQLRLRRLLPGAVVMGTGIVAMHYTGMAAPKEMTTRIWLYWLTSMVCSLVVRR